MPRLGPPLKTTVRETESQFWTRKLRTFFWRRVRLEKETKNKETQSESEDSSRREKKLTQELMAKDETANRRQRLGARCEMIIMANCFQSLRRKLTWGKEKVCCWGVREADGRPFISGSQSNCSAFWVWPYRSMRDLSFLTTNGTRAPCSRHVES